MADKIPNSYKDPYWSDIAAKTEDKLDLPEGLLQSIVMNGEKSNNDQVSSVGAKTPFQITPTTRKLAIKTYGIDPYANPSSAAEVAGKLLKDSLKRNNGNIEEAIGEYHGGLNRDNWGPITEAYQKRVMQGLNSENPSSESQSTFDKVQTEMQQPTGAITNIYNAYKSGKMNEQQKADFEADVKSGKLILPSGANLNEQSSQNNNPVDTSVLPQGIIDAYNNGKMNEQQKADFENDVKNGIVKLPNDKFLQNGRIYQSQMNQIPGMENIPAQSIPQSEPPPGILGHARAGAETLQNLAVGGIAGTVGAAAGLTAGLLGAAAGQGKPAEVGQATNDFVSQYIQNALTPNKQSELGQQYSENVINALAPLPGLGGELGALAEGASFARQGLRPTVGNILKQTEKPVQTQPLGQTPTPIKTPKIQPTAEELANTARTASAQGPSIDKIIGTTERATTKLANQVASDIDVPTLESARRLGVEDYLQEDHLTTNQAVRELYQGIKSQPTSELGIAEQEGLQKVGERADALINELGGTKDLSTLNENVKDRITSIQKELDSKAKDLYEQLDNSIDPKTEAPADNVLKFINERADKLGGTENLTSVEKNILQKLSSKEVPIEQQLPSGRMSPKEYQDFINAPKTKTQQPTYSLVDSILKDLNQAKYKNSDIYKNTDSGLLKKLTFELEKDRAAAVPPELKSTYEAASNAVRTRKAVENDIQSLFGDEINKSIVGKLSDSIQQLSKGNTSGMQQLLQGMQKLPESMKQQVMASGLSTAFGKAGKNGTLNFNSFANWYEGLAKNKQAYKLVMDNLPTEAKVQLNDLYKVANGIRMATRERIGTGRITEIRHLIQGADNLTSKLFNIAKKYGGFYLADLTTGGHGIGAAGAITSALTKNKAAPIKAVDTLLASPEFRQATRDITLGKEPTKVAAKLAYSKPFDKFIKAIKNPVEMKDRQKWILDALKTTSAASNNQQRSK